MANIGPNKGRRLTMAFGRFAAMLIEEAQDFTGMTYSELDEALGFPAGRCTNYTRYPVRAKSRKPQAAGIQNFENRVARLLKRPAHIVVIENLALLNTESHAGSACIGIPDAGINLRQLEQIDLLLSYENDWPTYRRLKYNPRALLTGESLIVHYAWQWGILYDRGMLPEPWKTKMAGITGDVAIKTHIPQLMALAKANREANQHAISAAILPETGCNGG